ncbi:uncharacterized protein LOC107883222 [Acyrthosiphon pisum]|uniref:Uncharacterized protein n=1 Tax=Acyrthosiphon pisum TaxID=7029 RepID=A0A8R2H4P0_ACYPI|nr:uncharacterized protein LOC107883222 [Acyrthosiphon pisum]|eukprot:XP_016658340.1 PREDICTED: uncharacterized protein LOC107883222 [Acyrthosiphon pisum]
MKCLFYLLVFVTIVISDTPSKPLFLPQLPVGEYKINILALIRCELSTDELKFNYHLSKTSVNTTEIKGNTTLIEPLDDSFNVEINLAVKDSVGGWRDNAHIFKTPKACSSLKMWAGKFWKPLMETIGMHNHNCPIPAVCII